VREGELDSCGKELSHSTSTDHSSDYAKESALFKIRKAVAVQSRTTLLLLLIVMAAATVAVGVALATPPVGTVGTLLNRGANPDEATIHTDAIKFKTDGPTDILVVTQTWQPGGYSGWHTHAGLVLFTLKSGTISVFDGSCNERIVNPGDALVEPVGEPMNVKNYGSVPAVAYFAIVNPPGAPGRDDAPNPGCEIP
jgi:quercetin dioxygenase-like cupin family protein